MEYHKAHDIERAKRMLGHKSILNTDICVHLEELHFESIEEEYHVRVAENPEEIKVLLETAFEYACSKGDLMFFRKRK
jgi:hypothetical protein